MQERDENMHNEVEIMLNEHNAGVRSIAEGESRRFSLMRCSRNEGAGRNQRFLASDDPELIDCLNSRLLIWIKVWIMLDIS
jgi:hypothetical protein